MTNALHTRKFLLGLKLIPNVFVSTTDIRIGNFRLLKDKTSILVPKGPGYRKWISVDALPLCEVQYHLDLILKEKVNSNG